MRKELTIRVCIVTHSFAPRLGGIETHIAQISKELSVLGWEVEVLVQEPDSSLPRIERHGGYVVRRFGGWPNSPHYRTSFGLAQFVRRHSSEFDVLHVHNYHSSPALLATYCSSVPVVITTHYHGETASRVRDMLHIGYRILARRMLDKAAVIICETNEERERLKSVFPEMDPRVTIIPPGTSRRPPSARQRQDRVRVLSVGRLDGYKRVDQAIRAMRFLPNNYVLCVVGDGPSRSDLEDECAKFGLTDRVQFLGRLSDEDLGAQWELADIFVTLSRLEAWGLGVLDALATGIPCVVSAIPAHQAVSLLDPGHAVEVSLDANDEAVADAIQMAHSIGFFSPTGLPTWSWVAEQLQSAYLNAVGGVLLPGDAGPSQHL